MQDFHTPAWTFVVAEIDKELKRLRGELEGDHDATKTASIRGEIRALKRIRDMPTRASLDNQLRSPLSGDE